MCLDGAILVGTDVLLEMDRRTHDVFVGFDEVFLFETQPDEVPPPEVVLTSELPLTEQPAELLQAMSDWMSRSGCSVAMGDGCGVNIITVDREIANLFRLADIRLNTL